MEIICEGQYEIKRANSVVDVTIPQSCKLQYTKIIIILHIINNVNPSIIEYTVYIEVFAKQSFNSRSQEQ